MRSHHHNQVSWKKLVSQGFLWMSIILFVLIFVRYIFVQHDHTPSVQEIYHDFSKIAPGATQLGNVFTFPDHSHREEQSLEKKKPKIAYIFAGSARSFVCPKVHWSLKLNVLDAFGGDAYSFVRISVEDNKNVKTGKGVIWTPTYNQEEITEALKLLNPRTIEYFSLNNQEEEMKKYYPGEAHTVFRENDLRRYSMFFNRCMGYRLVLDYEKKHNMKFDWVVLIRLDAAWSGPVSPIEEYANDRVWLTETGYVAYNDQFMLIPRQFSDYLFDLNTKVDRNVYCLGGPDVEVHWKCNATYLAQKGVAREKINTTLSYCCSDVFDINQEGYSETIHYRHFLHGKIPVSFARFLVYLTRYLPRGCVPDCDRLMYNFKTFAFAAVQRKYPYFAPMTAMDTRASTLSLVDTAQCYAEIHASSLWQPPSAAEYHRAIELRRLPPVDYSRPFSEQLDKVPTNILFLPQDFTAWFIHPMFNAEGCFGYDAFSHEISWDHCLVHLKRKGGFRHHPHQTWFVSLPPHRPVSGSALLGHAHPFAAMNNERRSLNFTRIMMMVREPRGYMWDQRAICLAHDHQARRVVMRKCVRSYQEDPSQWFFVRGEGPGSHPMTTVSMIRSVPQPDWCVSRGNEVERGDQLFVTNGSLVFRRCSEPNPQTMYFEFELLP